MNFRRIINRIANETRRHKPEIELIGGLLITAGATVAIAKVSYSDETHEIIDDYKDDILRAEDSAEKRDITFTAAKGLVKRYALPVGLYILGNGLVVKSHADMTNMVKGLCAANALLTASIADNQIQMKHEDGTPYSEKELQKIKEKDLQSFSEEDRKAFAKEEARMSKIGISPYSFFFDETNPNFKDPISNLTFLKAKEKEMQQVVDRKGYITVADIKTMVGETRISRADLITGYLDRGGKYPLPIVDLGIDDIYRKDNRALDWVYNGVDNTILINPIGLTNLLDESEAVLVDKM